MTMLVNLYCGCYCTSSFYEEAWLAKTSHSLYLLWFSFVVFKIWRIIQVVYILKEQVSVFVCITFLGRLFLKISQIVLSLNIKICASCNTTVNGCLALPIGAEQKVRDHGLIRCCYGSRTTRPPHVLTSCNMYILPLANHRHRPCVERFWRISHSHFKQASLAGALLGGFSLGSTRREITSISPVMCSSEYCTRFTILHIQVQGKSTTRRTPLAP